MFKGNNVVDELGLFCRHKDFFLELLELRGNFGFGLDLEVGGLGGGADDVGGMEPWLPTRAAHPARIQIQQGALPQTADFSEHSESLQKAKNDRVELLPYDIWVVKSSAFQATAN